MKTLIIIFFIIIFILVVIFYNSGSCEIKKEFECSSDFCLFKEFPVQLSSQILNNINEMLENKDIQKRVSITVYPETLFNCALPNKNGATISTKNIEKYSPELIQYYQTDLCKTVSELIDIQLYPTDLSMPTSCAILIYEKENDWINWHYDYNYYNGRFFTVLIPITHDLTCTKFQFKDQYGGIVSLDLTNNGLVFEGNYLYHRASKLCDGQKRVMLSCQYVTNNDMNFINKMRIKLKDFAYTGRIF